MRQELLSLILIARECAKKQFADGQIGKESFNRYRDLIIERSKIYDHHLGNNGSFKNLADRFVLETVILHVVTNLREILDHAPAMPSPIFENGSFYSWYKFDFLEEFRILAEKIDTLENPEIEIIDACHQIISDLAGRHIGEFYTPAPLVEHLIKLSKFDPKCIQKSQRIVDPACGGGMILVRTAQIYLEYCVRNDIKPEEFLPNLEKAIYGFDIQPFAIALSRTMLGWIACRYSQQPINIRFDNIKLIDPLSEFSIFWETPIFDFVISNPPFMSLKKESIPYLENYGEIIYGHPNLYSLFIWWAIKASKTKSNISLLIPQSILAGAYFERLRRNIASQTKVTAITRLLDRKGVIGNADQQMMVLVLQKNKKTARENSTISLMISKNLSEVDESKPLQVDYSKVIREIKFSNIWVISNRAIDYEIEELACAAATTLSDVSDFKIGNGGYVWNQNKDSLIDVFESGSFPLVSAASIANFKFTFPHTGTHASKNRSFSKLTPKLEADLKFGDMILIQRTTPRKIGRRLVCCLLGEDFQRMHQKFFIENHVNYIVSKNSEIELLKGLSGWLNSDVINFVFQMRNGSTQVSVFELGLLPVKVSLLPVLSEFVSNINISQDKKKELEAINSLNNKIYDDLGITPKQKKRVKEVLSWKE